jgi:hypothetical protein
MRSRRLLGIVAFLIALSLTLTGDARNTWASYGQ